MAIILAMMDVVMSQFESTRSSVDRSSNLEDVKKTDLHTADKILPHNPPATPSYPIPDTFSGWGNDLHLCTWNTKINPNLDCTLKAILSKV